jgi:hypothetical protein
LKIWAPHQAGALLGDGSHYIKKSSIASTLFEEFLKSADRLWLGFPSPYSGKTDQAAAQQDH